MTLPLQSKPQRYLFSTCARHPSKPITGFCSSCLHERLAGIDPETHQETPLTHLAAELRRSKSYSSTTNPSASSISSTTTTTGTTAERRRKSCDVKAGNTLSDLFDLDDKRRYSDFSRKPKGVQLREEGNAEEIICNVNLDEVHMTEFEEDGEFKTIKEFIDLEWKKKRNGGRDFRSIWEAASVSFGKKLGRWQRKQNSSKKDENLGTFVEMERPPGIRKLWDAQSDMGEHGFGRRSCDTDPRVSVDVARFSVDDLRYPFDEPRASWDGYLTGRTCPRLAPLVSVVEDGKVSDDGGEDMREKKANEGGYSPGGTAQTRDYYSQRKRRSFDRLGSIKRVGLGDDELKSLMNTKASPGTVGLFPGAKLLVTEKELRDSNWYSIKDYGGDGVDSIAKDVDSVVGGVIKKSFKFKKEQRWRGVWNMWGLIHRRSESKCGDEESIGNVDDEPVAESWQKLSGVTKGEGNGIMSHKLIRSYTVSMRDSCQMACGTSGIDPKENGMKRREDLVLQRNRSAKYSPKNLDNGLLRLYLTPLRSYGRSKSRKSRLKNHQSMSRNSL